jgi:hypothetical protein
VARNRQLDLETSINQQQLAYGGVELTSENTNEVFHGNFISPIVYFNIISIKIQLFSRVGKDRTRELVARVAGGIICQHENNLGIRYTKSLHGAIPMEELNEFVTEVGIACTYIPNALAIC